MKVFLRLVFFVFLFSFWSKEALSNQDVKLRGIMGENYILDSELHKKNTF